MALLQETVPPAAMRRDHLVYRPLARARAWGSAVVALGDGIDVQEIDAVRTRYSTQLFSMLGSVPGAVMVARAAVPEFGSVTFVSVYGVMEHVYSQTTMLRIVADLIPLFDSPEGEHVVLGGDFNVSTTMAAGRAELPRCKAILHAIESLGLQNLAEVVKDRPPRPERCPCGEAECKHMFTYYTGQLDYLYATPSLARRCQRLHVPTDTTELSDHMPIVAEFDLTTRLEQTKWDPESFTLLLRDRHGQGAHNVAENLMTWARVKQDQLRYSGHPNARLDRFPTSEGAEPQLWFMLDVADETAVQFTCSLLADGRLRMQFQWMRGHFASEDARREVWRLLNAIPGIELAERLNGLPTFPIAALANEERLKQFCDVLDYIVDETLHARATPNTSPI